MRPKTVFYSFDHEYTHALPNTLPQLLLLHSSKNDWVTDGAVPLLHTCIWCCGCSGMETCQVVAMGQELSACKTTVMETFIHTPTQRSPQPTGAAATVVVLEFYHLDSNVVLGLFWWSTERTDGGAAEIEQPLTIQVIVDVSTVTQCSRCLKSSESTFHFEHP